MSMWFGLSSLINQNNQWLVLLWYSRYESWLYSMFYFTFHFKVMYFVCLYVCFVCWRFLKLIVFYVFHYGLIVAPPKEILIYLIVKIKTKCWLGRLWCQVCSILYHLDALLLLVVFMDVRLSCYKSSFLWQWVMGWNYHFDVQSCLFNIQILLFLKVLIVKDQN